MANEHTNFWLELFNMDDLDRRSRLWNGYIAWMFPQLNNRGHDARTPSGGWPVLNSKEKAMIEDIANRHEGHPKFVGLDYMDFRGHCFENDVDFTGLCLIRANFEWARFNGSVVIPESTMFLRDTLFVETVFYKEVLCEKAYFENIAYFARTKFERYANFIGVEFTCGANFSESVFKMDARFTSTKFREIGISELVRIHALADFSKVTFHGRTSFRNVTFGDVASPHQMKLRAERKVEFSDSTFNAATEFQGAVFHGVPAFFNASLHEDTDFSDVDWQRAKVSELDINYAIRAWERLELIMSQLEKPVDRHQFYRLKMRVRRRLENPLIRLLNWLFDVLCEYGWSLSRALACWFGHWIVAGILLFVNAGEAALGSAWCQIAKAAFLTAFSNAHSFLGLSRIGGYHESRQELLEQHDQLGLLVSVGVVEAILGPLFLFLALLAVRNRFRLA